MSEKTEIPAELRKSEFALFIGRAPSYVTKLLNEGKVVMTQDGRRVKVAESLRLIEQGRAHASWSTKPPIPQAPAGQEAPPATEPPPASGDAQLRQSRAEAEARKAAAQADQEEMKASQMRGDLIPREEVEAALGFVGGAIRGALDLLPDQTAPIVAPITDTPGGVSQCARELRPGGCAAAR
jgi:hypothetical protein